MTISELIEQLEKIKKEHGDLPVKTWNYDEFSEQYYYGDVDYPEYHKPDEDDRRSFHYDEEECVVIGE